MEFYEDTCVRRYLGGLADSTAENRLPLLEDFFEAVVSRPKEAVEFQKENPGSYRFVDLAYAWVEKNGNLSVSSMKGRVGMVRGFFVANRAPLPEDRHRFHSDKEPVMGELSVDEFRRISLSCDRKYRAAYLTQFQSGSGVGELIYINTHHAEHVWTEVKKGKQIIRLTMPGRKQNRNIKPYYCFIGKDAVTALRDYFHSIGWQRDTVLFRNKNDKPITRDNLSSYFRAHAIKTGVIRAKTWPCLDCGGKTVRRRRMNNGVSAISYICTECQSVHLASEYDLAHGERTGVRYRVRTHELRDLFRTRWHKAQRYAGADASAGEFFMGHSIDAQDYDKVMKDVAYARSQFREAMSWLNVLSEEPQKVDRTEVDEELEGTKAEVEVLRREVAEMKRLLRSPELLEHLKALEKQE